MTLRLRLLALVGVVVVASLAAVYAGSSRLVRLEFERLEERALVERTPPRVDTAAIVRALVEHHHQRSGWEGVEARLRDLRKAFAAENELLLVDGGMQVIATSADIPAGLRVGRRPGGLMLEYGGPRAAVKLSVPIVAEAAVDQTTDSVLVVPQWRGLNATRSLTIHDWLLWIVGTVGVAALAMTVLITNRLVRPLEHLHAAVEDVQRGELGGQVDVPASHTEIARLAEAFNAMSAQLARDDIARRNLVNDVAHELRTPLTRLICAVEMLQDGLKPPNAAALGSLRDDLTVLQRLVEDLQILALAETRKLPLNGAPLDLGAELHRYIAAQPAGERDRISLDAAEGLVVQADAIRLQQIVANLVRNALSHGGPNVRVSIQARASKDGVELSVADDGHGIAREHLPFVFDRFYRGDASRNRETGGSGLGLAIVKNLVELHGGTITVESSPDQGTRFRVALPPAQRLQADRL